MTKHAYLPTTIIFDNGSVFMYHVINEVAEFMELPYNMPQQSMRKQLECLNERMPHWRKLKA